MQHKKKSCKCAKFFHYVLFGLPNNLASETIQLFEFDDNQLPKKYGFLTATLNYYLDSKVNQKQFGEVRETKIFNNLLIKILLDSVSYPLIYRRVFINYTKLEIKRAIETSLIKSFTSNNRDNSVILNMHVQMFSSVVIDTMSHINSIENDRRRRLVVSKIIKQLNQ